MFVSFRTIFLLSMVVCTQGCGEEPWNDPYPQFDKKANTLYSAFTERPKHLDPALSYSAEEAIFTYQIYEPPLQYHYLKRPYELVTLSAKEMPTVRYVDKNNTVVSEEDPNVAFSVYQIKIKEGIHYQPHPAFAKNPQGEYDYHQLTPKQVKDKHTLQDFSHTGTRELTAQDYVFQIKRLADPTLNSPIAGMMANHIVGFKDFGEKLKKNYAAQKQDKAPYAILQDTPLEGVKALDKYTYEIKINGKYPQFVDWLAMPFFAPIPWEAIQFYGQPLLAQRNITLDWYPVGTGPFLLAVNNPNLQMILAKNPNYHGELYPSSGDKGDAEKGLLKKAGQPLPFLDNIVFVLEKESIPYWNKFLQGYYDQSGVSSNNFDQALQSVGAGNLALSKKMEEKNIRLSSSVLPTIFYWGFNMLDDTVGGYTAEKKYLRQAIAIALDIEEYINIFLNGSGIPAQSPLPPGIFGNNATVQERKPITEAKALLAKAGYANGINPQTGQALILYLDIPTAGSPDSAAQLSWMRKQFEKLGIELIIRGTQYSRFQDKMRNGDFQIFSWGWSADYPDPENFFFLLYSLNSKVKHGGENVSNYHNATFDALFEKMKNMHNSPERAEIIRKMIALLQEDMPWFGGYHPKLFSLKQQWVAPTKPNEMSRNTLKYIAIDAPLREKLQTKWNQPIVWPLFVGILGFILLCVPAGISYWVKKYKPKTLRKP